MAPERIASVARAVVLASAVALLVVFFLDWWRVSIDTPGVKVESSASGWSGWGLVAGLLLLALLLVEAARAFGRERPETPLVLAILGVGTLLFTIVSLATGGADITAGPVTIESSSLRWPAWLGLALAIVLAGAAAGAERVGRREQAGVPRATPA